MKPIFACLAAASALAIAVPAAAQDYVVTGGALGAYDGYYEYDAPVPPRRVPDYRGGRTETVVTTTRRIVTEPDYGAYAPPAVVTTRRVVTSTPVYGEPLDVVATGSLGRPLPPRRISKDVVFAPAPERVVTTRRVAPAPVIIEERRVETTRRILGPAPADWE